MSAIPIIFHVPPISYPPVSTLLYIIDDSDEFKLKVNTCHVAVRFFLDYSDPPRLYRLQVTSSLEEPPSYLFALVITKVLILHASVDFFVTYTRDANLWPHLLQRGQMAVFKRNTHEL